MTDEEAEALRLAREARVWAAMYAVAWEANLADAARHVADQAVREYRESVAADHVEGER